MSPHIKERKHILIFADRLVEAQSLEEFRVVANEAKIFYKLNQITLDRLVDMTYNKSESIIKLRLYEQYRIAEMKRRRLDELSA